MKALVEEGIAEPGATSTTRVTSVGNGLNIRLLFINKARAEEIINVETSIL